MKRESVFISYCHEDAKWLRSLQKMLRPLTRDGTLTIWDDTRLQPGQQWRQEIDTALSKARVAVLLVSPGFLASDFIAHNELPPLLEAAAKEGVTILWVAVSACLFGETPLRAYQAVNNPARPLDSYRGAQRNAELARIAQAITNAMSPAPQASTASTHPAPPRPASLAPKFFVYVSDSKLEMLFSQLAPEVRKAIVGSGDGPAPSPIAKISPVLDMLRNHDMIGTLSDPKDYVEGVLDMRWGHYGGGVGRDDGLVYFGGELEHCIVGLGGSARHVIGATGSSSAHSHSATPALVKVLLAELSPGLAQEQRHLPNVREDLVPLAVELATTQMIGPLERMEFVAKVLCVGKSSHFPGRRKILLATPLYVASKHKS